MLNFFASASETDLRLAIIECGKVCYARRLLTSNDGNISVRLGDSQVLITPSGVSKGRIFPDDVMIMELDGKVLNTKAGYKPSSETPMHLEVYKQRPDVRAVIHAHPVFATTLTVAGMAFPTDILPEVTLLLGEVPVTEYATPSSQEDAEVIRPFIRSHDVIILRQHGVLAVGSDLEAALVHLERIEHVAEVFWRAQVLGHVERIPQSALQKLRRVRQNNLEK